MDALRKVCSAGVAIALTLVASPALSWAATSTVLMTVDATVPSVVAFAADRDANSVTRFTATHVVFDRLDSQDGQPDGNGGFMYAPYRSEVNKNWHLLRIDENSTSMTLSADVPAPLTTRLDVFFGGFFADAGGPGTQKSTDWENLDSFSRTIGGTFKGIGPFNYRLNVSGLPTGTYMGTITFTLTTA